MIHALGYRTLRNVSTTRRRQAVSKAARIGWLARTGQRGNLEQPVDKQKPTGGFDPGTALHGPAEFAGSVAPAGRLVDMLPLPLSSVGGRDHHGSDDDEVDDGDDFEAPMRGKGSAFVDDTGAYVPHPIDTSSIQMDAELSPLVELLARNAHTVWAEGKIRAGWCYAPAHSAGLEATTKTSPMLVPYEFLDEREKVGSLARFDTLPAIDYCLCSCRTSRERTPRSCSRPCASSDSR